MYSQGLLPSWCRDRQVWKQSCQYLGKQVGLLSVLPWKPEPINTCCQEADILGGNALGFDNILTHWGLVTPYGVGDLGQQWFR